MAFHDGTKRLAQKSKILDVLYFNSTSSKKIAYILVIDMITQYRITSTNLPDTFKELIICFLSSLLSGYLCIDIVSDCYRDHINELAERKKRGFSLRIIIGLISSKIPRDISKFLGEYKTQLVSLTLYQT